MTERFDEEPEIISLEDEDGGVEQFVVLMRLTVNEQAYIVLGDPEDEDGVMIFRLEEDDEGENFLPIEDEDELQDVFDYFRTADEDYDFGDAE